MKHSITYFSVKEIWIHLFIFFHFFDNFVVDFKIFVILNSISFTFTLLILLSSLGPNLVFFKTLIFRGDILKNMYKEILSFLASIFPLYTLISNSEFEKKLTKILFSLRKMQLEGSAMTWLIDNIFAHYLHCFYLKHAFKNCCVSSKNLKNFNRILCKI